LKEVTFEQGGGRLNWKYFAELNESKVPTKSNAKVNILNFFMDIFTNML